MMGSNRKAIHVLWLCVVIHNIVRTVQLSTSGLDTAPAVETTTVPAVQPTTTFTLNLSEAWSTHWVKTVIKVPTSEDIESSVFRFDMESKLAMTLNEGLLRLNSILAGEYTPLKRRKRAVTNGNATVQITNTTRSYNEPSHTSLVYYLVEGHPSNNLSTADRTVGLMELFSDQEIAIFLGYEVVLKAEPYLPPTPPKDRNLWIIGAVIGGVAGLIIIIWLIMFIYYKCTRPPNKIPSPRSPRSAKVADIDQIDYKGKDVKGFDYVRTEVGLENELERQNVPDYYRRYPMGSSELEGMYSPGETPPPPFRGHRPSSLGKGGVKGDKPITVIVATESQAKPTSKKPKSTEETLSTGADTDITQDSGRSEDKRPLRKGHRRHKAKGSGKAGQFENLTKMGHIEDSDAPEVTKHSKVKANKVPRDEEENSDDEEDENDSDEEAIRQRVEQERRRNKQRQRDKKAGQKKRPRQSVGDKEERRASNRNQQEAGHVLQNGHPKPPRKKRVKKRPPEEPPVDTIELQPIPDHNAIRPVIPGMQIQMPLGELESDSDDGFNPLNGSGGPDSHEKARALVNELLNEAFAMVTPTSPGSELGPVGSPRAPEPNQPAPQLPLDLVGRHTPLYVTPVSGYTGKLPGMYDPYEASDQAAKIIPPSRTREGSHSSHASNRSNRSNRSPRSPHQYTNPAYMADVGSRNNSEINATSTPRSVNMPNGFGPDSPRAFKPYEKPDWPDPLPQAWDENGTLPLAEKYTGNNLNIPTRDNNDLSRYHISKPIPRDVNDDEVDIASDVMKTGNSAQPLIASIREEIERLAKRSQDHNSLRLTST